MIQLPWRRIAAVLLPLALAAYASPAQAQVTDSLRLRDRQQATDTVPADSVRAARRRARAIADTAGGLRRYRISPRTAFLRSLVLPGWGQSELGVPERGIIYFTLEAGSLWMVYKSTQKLYEAKDRERFLRATGQLEPGQRSGLVRDRRAQREDWLTLSIFWLFFSGADAFVAAHLRDFDAHVEVQPDTDGAVRLQATIPVGKRR